MSINHFFKKINKLSLLTYIIFQYIAPPLALVANLHLAKNMNVAHDMNPFHEKKAEKISFPA